MSAPTIVTNVFLLHNKTIFGLHANLLQAYLFIIFFTLCL